MGNPEGLPFFLKEIHFLMTIEAQLREKWMVRNSTLTWQTL